VIFLFNRLAWLLLCASLTYGAICTAQAQDSENRGTFGDSTEPSPPDSAQVHYLGEIIVTTDGLADESSVRTTVFSAHELESTPGTTARDLLKAVPGVGISTGRKDEAKITIRGFNARRVAILVDGRPMNIPYYGDFNLASIHSDKLEKIVIVKGPSSVSYGPNVMGGVVNFVSTSGRDHPGTSLTLRAGDNETGEFRLSHGLVKGTCDFYLSLRGGKGEGSLLSRDFTPTGYSGHEDGGSRNNSDWEEWDLFGKLGIHQGSKTDLALSFGYHSQEKGVPGAADEERYWRFTDWKRYFADLTLRRQLGPQTHLEAKGYGDIFTNTLVDYEDERYDINSVYYNSTHHNWDLGTIIALEHDWSATHHGTYGITVREDQIKKRMNPTDPWRYHHQVVASLYGEHQGRLAGKFNGTIGLSDNLVVHNHLKDVDHVLGYSAGINTSLKPGWRLFTAFGQSSRFPTLNQLWSLNSGNRELLPEVTQRFELGLDATIRPRIQGEATFFYNVMDELITRDVRRQGRYYNISAASTWGFELGSYIDFADWLQVNSAYTFTHTENDDTGQDLDLIPEHKIDTRVTACSRDRRTEWTFIVTCVGDRFDSEALTADQRLSGYITADCQVNTLLSPHLTLALEALNLSDVSYEEEVGYPAPGRSLYVSLTLDY
jgi:iron complex outermembrane recepter protein